MERDRAALAAALRESVERILAQVAEEAARATTMASSVPDASLVASYVTWMRPYVPTALAAAAADDARRSALLERWLDTTVSQKVRPVPPVARRGLFNLGFRLARTSVAAYAQENGLDAPALDRELADLESDMLATIARRSLGVA
ncbi:MAG: hypothetical protein AUI58_00550 [Chloroflexi bacterium 13_1_40CM_2_70_6]|nr:MAG: hypothetical protein AUI58_00550 [Chloroflexi bacterium 13_1_40CM_2_70_6]